MPTKAILKTIEKLGYAVMIRRTGEAVELVAVNESERHVARCDDGDGDEETYRAACRLAELVGIDLEDG